MTKANLYRGLLSFEQRGKSLLKNLTRDDQKALAEVTESMADIYLETGKGGRDFSM